MESLELIQTLINAVGFPIACVVGLALFIRRVYTDNLSNIKTTIDNNTKAMEAVTRLCDKIDMLSDKVDNLEDKIDAINN